MAEITLHDAFGQLIARTVRQFNYTHNLEIGSWDGTGSTWCFRVGMGDMSGDRLLQCLEIDPDRFNLLRQNTRACPYIEPINLSSVGRQSFLLNSFEEMWQSPYNMLPAGPLKPSQDLVRSWYDHDAVRLPETGFLDNPLLCLEKYDAVLIDGSEFTGYSEFVLLRDRTQCFFLDDVFGAYKCNQIWHELTHDPAWELIDSDAELRNGYAAFKRRK